AGPPCTSPAGRRAGSPATARRRRRAHADDAVSLDRIRAHRASRYLSGVAASLSTVAVLIPLRFLIEPLPAPPFLLTVIAVAWFVGLGPAVVSVALTAFAIDYWFIPPLFAITTTWHEVASVVSFALVGVVVAWLTATRRHV